MARAPPGDWQAGSRGGGNATPGRGDDKRMRILIAEDDPTSRLVLLKTLEKLGYETFAAKDGAEAWTMFQQQRPQVVITDWMMPRMDGLELCSRIRSDPRNDRYCYLIVLTALGGKKNYLAAMNAGTDDFLTKPFDPDELVTRLRVAERIVRMEATLQYLAAIHGCCPDCDRIEAVDGRWTRLHDAAMAAEVVRPAPRCPDCVRKEQAVPARTVPAGAVSTSR